MFSLCVLEGYVKSSYFECREGNTTLSRHGGAVVLMAGDGFIKAIEFVGREWGAGRTDNFLHNEVVSMLAEVKLLYIIFTC